MKIVIQINIKLKLYLNYKVYHCKIKTIKNNKIDNKINNNYQKTFISDYKIKYYY